jgi:hypothetical protein
LAGVDTLSATVNSIYRRLAELRVLKQEVMVAMPYDASALEELARTLNDRAPWAVFDWCITGLFAGAAVGTIGAQALADSSTANNGVLVGIISGFIGVLCAYPHGASRELALTVEAQRTLCLVEIEKSTRVLARQEGDDAVRMPTVRDLGSIDPTM